MGQRDIIAIGGSLGAVEAVKQLCGDLPPDIAATLFIVVHIGSESRNMLAGAIGARSAIPVTTAVGGETPQRGHAYVAPAGHHLLVMDGVVRLGRGPRENMARPAIDPLFRSVGISYGPRAIGVVLTGMLNDGAAGLADLKRCGGTTVVQNPTEATAPEMPLGALAGSDVDYRAPLGEMAQLLVKLSGEDAAPAPEVPEDIRLEAGIALGRRSDPETTAKFADPVRLSCPACGGVLSQIRRWPPLRFRCQVGHAYTAEVLAAEQESDVDEAMRVALRIVEERMVLIEKLADDARRNGHHAAAAAHEQRAGRYRAYVESLQKAVLKNA
ncbi:MAG TPA: chemotaxis protein CheB [Burkholderiales bacterium]|nr:chemotaxis protein CheB [Burkholderiales bacterium]